MPGELSSHLMVSPGKKERRRCRHAAQWPQKMIHQLIFICLIIEHVYIEKDKIPFFFSLILHQMGKRLGPVMDIIEDKKRYLISTHARGVKRMHFAFIRGAK